MMKSSSQILIICTRLMKRSKICIVPGIYS
ncbi:hypothetical protein Gotur_000403 [Gossypium turneri]